MVDTNLKVLFVSAEVAPFAKAGGLADVAGSLPTALKAEGVDIRIAMPAYRMVLDNPDYAVSAPIGTFPVLERPGVERCVEVRMTWIRDESGASADVPVYLIGELEESGSRNPYFDHAVDSSTIYALEPDPYIFFDRAVAAWLDHTAASWTPDIVHSNDWHCGLIPLFIKIATEADTRLNKIVHLFTIHNLAYQGEFGRELWYKTGLADEYYGIDGLECYGRWSFMKGALNYADYVTTVSPRYAEEIVTSEYGNGVDGLLRKRELQGRLCGILNGIDTRHFDPATDTNIPANFSATNPKPKQICKAELQKELGLAQDPDALVIGMVTRFAEQKGLDLVHGEAERLLQLNVQFALLGMGDSRFERFLQELCAANPLRAAVRIEFNAPLAQRIYAGADLFLMPSRFEPCGLGQLIALRYGAIPIVRSTGGLADTIIDYTASPETGNGFAFDEYTGGDLDEAVGRAVATLTLSDVRTAIVQRVMAQDWSWERSAQLYLHLYEQAQSH